MKPTTLYRFYDADGGLLYIGITSVGPNRWLDHEEHRAWWSKVARSVVEHFPDRSGAMAAEAAAIRAERPPHNTVHAGVQKAPRTRVRRPLGTLAQKPDGRWAVAISLRGGRYQTSVRDKEEAELLLAALIGRTLSGHARQRAIDILAAGSAWTPDWKPE